jgi:hypothetical protein
VMIMPCYICPRRYRAAPRRGGVHNNTYGDFYLVGGCGGEKNPVEGLQVASYSYPFLADLNSKGGLTPGSLALIGPLILAGEGWGGTTSLV